MKRFGLCSIVVTAVICMLASPSFALSTFSFQGDENRFDYFTSTNTPTIAEVKNHEANSGWEVAVGNNTQDSSQQNNAEHNSLFPDPSNFTLQRTGSNISLTADGVNASFNTLSLPNGDLALRAASGTGNATRLFDLVFNGTPIPEVSTVGMGGSSDEQYLVILGGATDPFTLTGKFEFSGSATSNARPSWQVKNVAAVPTPSRPRRLRAARRPGAAPATTQPHRLNPHTPQPVFTKGHTHSKQPALRRGLFLYENRIKRSGAGDERLAPPTRAGIGRERSFNFPPWWAGLNIT